jgi:hypothetical protein
LAHLLSLAQVWLTQGSGYSSNSSVPKTEMQNAHVEIPISNYLVYSWLLEKIKTPKDREVARRKKPEGEEEVL